MVLNWFPGGCQDGCHFADCALLTEQEFYDALKKGWLAGGVIKIGMVNLGVAFVMVRTMMVGRQGGCAMLQALPEPVRKWMRCAARLPGTA